MGIKNGTGRIRTGDLALQIGVGFPDSLDYLFTVEIDLSVGGGRYAQLGKTFCSIN
jgi:hypothetical protein